MELVIADQITPFTKLKLAEIGPEKSGKSRLAATGRKPVLFFDFDQRAESIAGISGVYVITFRDRGYPYQPEAFSEMLDVMTKLEQSLDLSLLGFDVPPGTLVKTIVDDSMSTMAKAAMEFALFTTKEIRREISVGGKMMVRIPKSYDAWAAEMSMVEAVVLRQLALPGVDVITVFHEAAEEAPESTDTNPRFTGKVTTFPVRYHRLLKFFNEVYRITRAGGTVPQVKIAPDYQFTTATCLNLDPVEQPNIEEMLRKQPQKTT